MNNASKVLDSEAPNKNYKELFSKNYNDFSKIKAILDGSSGRERHRIVGDIYDQFDLDPKDSSTKNIMADLKKRVGTLEEVQKEPEDFYNPKLFDGSKQFGKVEETDIINPNLFEFNDSAQYIGKEFGLSEVFKENPNAQVVVMVNGKRVTVSKRSFEKSLRDRKIGLDGDSRDSLGDVSQDEKYKIVEVYNPDILDFTRINKRNEVGGINDMRISIAEHKTENYYCPSNISCIKKCVLEFCRLNELNQQFEYISKLEMPDVAKSNTINKILAKGCSLRIAFSYEMFKTHSKNGLTAIPLKEVEVKDIGVGYSHSILLFETDKYTYHKLYDSEHKHLYKNVKAEKISFKNIKDFSKFKDIAYNPMYETTKQTKDVNLMAFDYETYLDGTSHIPYLVTVAYDDSEGKNKFDYCWDLDSPVNLQKEFIRLIRNRLFDLLHEKQENRCLEEKQMSSIDLTMVAHNGSAYDFHLFLRYFDDPNININTYIGDESKIKCFTITFKNITFSHSVRFIDSMLMENNSLEKCCQIYGVSGKVKENNFNIADYLTKQLVMENEIKILKYGIQDSVCLLEMCKKMETSYKEATGLHNLSILSFISLAAYSGACRDIFSGLVSKESSVHYQARREVVDFEQDAVFGGRLVVGSLKFDHVVEGEKMRNPDINSLYPSAMNNYEYPTGVREWFTDPIKLENMKTVLNNLTYEKMCIARVLIKVNKRCIIPLLPNKKEDGSIDTEEEVFECTATSIELMDAVKYGGYKILNVFIYEEWSNKQKIFSPFIQKMYNLRLEYKQELSRLKKIESKTEDDLDMLVKYEAQQLACKNIMNSSYGKIIQKPFDTVFKITTMKEWKNELCDQYNAPIQGINGKRQLIYKTKCKTVHNNRLPKYLGIFILSFSKRIMNEYISAVDGFFVPVIDYMDTDSMYLKASLFDKLKTKGLIGKELGQASNDYDNDIENYVSLGKKIKFCELDNGEIKTTFKGYGGLNKLSIEEKKKFFKELQIIAEDPSYISGFMDKTITRFNKKGYNITTSELCRHFEPTWPNHYKMINKRLYPKYYEVSISDTISKEDQVFIDGVVNPLVLEDLKNKGYNVIQNKNKTYLEYKEFAKEIKGKPFVIEQSVFQYINIIFPGEKVLKDKLRKLHKANFDNAVIVYTKGNVELDLRKNKIYTSSACKRVVEM